MPGKVCGRAVLGQLPDDLRCQATARHGGRCKALRAGQDKFCSKHGGGQSGQAAREAWRAWRQITWKIYREGFKDELVGLVAVRGRLVLGEAWLSARANGDPIIYQAARRAVATRYRKRILALGRPDILEELGIEL